MKAAAASDGLRILRAAEQLPVPWKNGGGLTRELAVHPPGSDLRQFDWRVSIAQIEVAGPFSRFPGVERRMAVLEGCLLLSIEAAPAVRLTAEDAALSFSGEAAVFAEPVGGAVTDLNVMTRRGRFESRLQHRRLSGRLDLAPVAGPRVLLALAGLQAGASPPWVQLGRLDALLIAPGTHCELAPAAAPTAALYLVELFARP